MVSISFVFFIILTLSSLGYCILMYRAYRGWTGLQQSVENTSLARITIIVPFRNEAESILTCLESLSHQELPVEQFDVLLVNDHSDDASAKIVSDFIVGRSLSNFCLVDLPDSKHGKKSAITYAIDIASTDYILTTDADCQTDPDWVQTVINKLDDPDVDMLCGPVKLEGPDNFLSNLQKTEYMFLQGVAAGLLNKGKPLLCSGANLAYKKALFIEVNGYSGNDDIASGDDTFLMFKFWERRKSGLHFLKDQKAIVKTGVVNTVDEFVTQRARWANKTKHYKDSSMIFKGLMIALAHFSVITMLIFYFIDQRPPHFLLGIVSLKTLMDIVFWKVLKKWFSSSINIWAFILFELCYPVFLVLILIKTLRSDLQWKGRSINTADA